MPSTSRIILLAVCLSAFVPSLASAQDFCVHCTQGGAQYQTFEDALKVANSLPTADRILLGPGTYTAPDTSGFHAGLSYPVEIIGAGKDETTVTGPANTTTVLEVDDRASAVSNLSIVVPEANDGLTKFGLAMTGGSATGISISSPGAGTHTIGANLDGTRLEDSQITLSPSNQTMAMFADTDTVVRGVDIT